MQQIVAKVSWKSWRKHNLYIEQLHKRIKNEEESRIEVNKTIDQQAEEIAELKAQLTKMETQLAELIQSVSALNNTQNFF